jgi:hypothetical protein
VPAISHDGSIARELFLAACFALVWNSFAFGSSCRLPRYRAGKISDTAAATSLTVSVGPAGFAPTGLICLVEHLRPVYANRKVLDILFFDRHEAAVHYLPGSIDPSPEAVEYQSQMHALYYAEPGQSKEYLLLMPDPLTYDPAAPFNTRFDFPISGAPTCKLQIANRCLLSFRHILYPWQGGTAKVSGDVAVTGVVNRDGSMAKIAVADAVVNPMTEKSVLVDAAVDNLKTWQFEDSKQSIPIRITYSFRLLQSSAMKYKTDVEFSLPERVTIETSEILETP